MTAPYAELIERLREMGAADPWDARLGEAPLNPDGPEAAKAIEALQADNDSMVENENRTARELAQADARIEALQADNERLRAALQKARPYVADLPIVGDADLAAIEAALSTTSMKGEADE